MDKKFKTVFFIVLFMMISIFSGALQCEPTVTLVANDWFPQHSSNLEEPGYIVEIARAAFETEGVDVHVKILPWLRALSEVKSGESNGLLTPTATEVKAHGLLKHKVPIAYQRWSFYARKDSKKIPDKYKKMDDMRGLSFINVSGSSYGSEYDRITKKYNNSIIKVIHGGTAETVERLFHLAKIRRGDVVVVSEDAAKYYLGTRPEISKLFQKIYHLKAEPLYIGFTSADKSRSAKYGKLLDRGLKKIKESGAYDRIMLRYHQSDY